MKKIFILALLFSFAEMQAQVFPGIRTGNHTGVNGVFFNPANIAGGARYDVNVFSINALVGNNKAEFSLGEFGRSFKGDSLKRKLFSAENGPTSGMVDVVVNGPSFMLKLNEASAIAFTTRARSIANIIDLDGRLAEQVIDDLNAATGLPYTIASANNQRMAVNAWTEIGASYARILMQKGQHMLKGGVSLKYLGGIGNAYINIDALNGRIDEDLLGNVYLADATGRITTGFGGLDVANMEGGDFFNFKNPGVGLDLGVVYEFRRANSSQYLLKAGLAITDLGSIKYKRDLQHSGSYQLDITGSERFYFNELSGKELDEYNDVFRSRPQYFTPLAGETGDYTVSLPTTIQLDLDYHLKNNFFAAFSTQLPVVSEKIFNSRYYSSFTLTPRYEGKSVGIYLPFGYNSLTNFNAGLSFRLGPVFIGSGSILSALLGGSRQADAHFGVRFGGGR